MSSTSVQKGLLTKAVNLLRQKTADVNQAILGRLVLTGTPGKDQDLLYDRRTLLCNTSASIKRSLNSVKERWERSLIHAQSVPIVEGEPTSFDELQSHWESLGADELIEEAEDLLSRVETALSLLPTLNEKVDVSLIHANPSPFNTSVNTLLTQSPVAGIQNPVHPVGVQSPQCQHAGVVPECEKTSASSYADCGAYHSNTSNVPVDTHLHNVTSYYMHPNQSITSNPSAGHMGNGLFSNALLAPQQHVKLPTFELPDFNGTVDSFPEFWDLYCAAIHNNTSLSPAHKFLYLKSYLKGNAASIISNFQPTAENYEEAIRIILNTYNRPEVLRNKLWDKLVAQPKASASVSSQRVTLCGIKAIWAQMQKLSEHPAATGTMKVIRSKFPDRTREKVGELRRKDDPSWTVDDLLRALDTVIEQLELMEDTDPKDNPSFSALSVQHEPRCRESRRYSIRTTSPFPPSSSTSRGMRSQQKVRCNFCLRQGHIAEDCRELRNPRERRRLCIAFKLCWRCFSTRHRSQECSKPRCYLCDGDHHRLLCYHTSSISHSVERAQNPSQSRSPCRRDSRSRLLQKFTSTKDSQERTHPSDSTSSSEDRSRSRDVPMRRSSSPHPKTKVGFTDPHSTHATCVVNASTCVTSFYEPIRSDDDTDSAEDGFTSFNHV